MCYLGISLIGFIVVSGCKKKSKPPTKVHPVTKGPVNSHAGSAAGKAALKMCKKVLKSAYVDPETAMKFVNWDRAEEVSGKKLVTLYGTQLSKVVKRTFTERWQHYLRGFTPDGKIAPMVREDVIGAALDQAEVKVKDRTAQVFFRASVRSAPKKVAFMVKLHLSQGAWKVIGFERK